MKTLIENLTWKGKIYGTWKKTLITLEKYRNVVRLCRDVMRKDEDDLELKEVKYNNNGFFMYVSSKRKIMENMCCY